MMNVGRTLRILSTSYLRNLRLKQRLSTRQQFLQFRLAIIQPNIGFRYLHLTSKRLDLPDHSKIAFPALSPTMEMGTIVSWQKKEGDQLNEGDLLCEIETDKATMGFEATEEGYLAKIIIPEGSKDVPVGKLLCIVVSNKDDVAAFKDFKADEDGAGTPPPTSPQAAKEEKQSPKEAQPVQQAQSQMPQMASDQGQRLKASPYAKKLAGEQGIDLTSLTGSGPGGRIVAADLAQASSHAPSVQTGIPSAEFTDIPLSNMRKTIAKRLAEAKSTIPHYYLTSELYIDKLIDTRKKLNNLLEKEAKKTGEKPQKLSINDFIIKASALACLRVPEANSSFMGNFIRQNLNVDVSVAVSTPSGLITPIIFDAHTKGIATIGYEVGLLAAKARDGKLQPHEFQGGTFTVSNLGMFGSVDHFTAIINPPQSCILAIGAARRKLVPIEEENGEDKYRSVTSLKVTLSCDHRVVDGAIGAVWLQYFKRFMEEPITMILWGTYGMDNKREGGQD